MEFRPGPQNITMINKKWFTSILYVRSHMGRFSSSCYQYSYISPIPKEPSMELSSLEWCRMPRSKLLRLQSSPNGSTLEGNLLFFKRQFFFFFQEAILTSLTNCPAPHSTLEEAVRHDKWQEVVLTEVSYLCIKNIFHGFMLRPLDPDQWIPKCQPL